MNEQSTNNFFSLYCFLLLVYSCFLFSCLFVFSSFLPARCIVFLFSFFSVLFASVRSCFFLFFFIIIFWGPSVFSDRLRGNPVRNHIMTICLFFWDQIAQCYIVTYADSHLHTYTYICRIIHNDTIITTDA